MNSPVTPLEPLMTGQDVADFLRISLSAVYNLAKSRQLPAVRIGSLWRFDPDTVRRFARGELPPPDGAPVVPIAGRRRRV